MTRRTRSLTLACLLATFMPMLTACEPSGGGTGGTVAIIDLDRVASEIGRDLIFKQAIAAEEKIISENLRTIGEDFTRQIKAEEDKLGSKATDEDKLKIAQLKQMAASQYQGQVREAGNRLQSKRVDLVNEFRAEVRPIALKVAESRGKKIILTRNDTVLEFHGDVDITSDVVNELKRSSPSAPVAPPAAEPSTTEPTPGN